MHLVLVIVIVLGWSAGNAAAPSTSDNLRQYEASIWQLPPSATWDQIELAALGEQLSAALGIHGTTSTELVALLGPEVMTRLQSAAAKAGVSAPGPLQLLAQLGRVRRAGEVNLKATSTWVDILRKEIGRLPRGANLEVQSTALDTRRARFWRTLLNDLGVAPPAPSFPTAPQLSTNR